MSSSNRSAIAESLGPYSPSSSAISVTPTSSASTSPTASTAVCGEFGRGGKGARGCSPSASLRAAYAASSRALRLAGSRARLMPVAMSMLYSNPAGHASPGYTTRQLLHSHIQSATPTAGPRAATTFHPTPPRTSLAGATRAPTRAPPSPMFARLVSHIGTRRGA